MPELPKSIVYIRPDTLGDLVIFSSALAQLQTAWPEARHTVLVRPGYDALAPLFPASVRWEVAPINPFSEQPGASRAALDRVFANLEKLQPDVIVAATLNRTWLEAAIAARFPAARRVALGHAEVDPLFAKRLKLELGVDATTAFSEVVSIEERGLDWENNHRLVDQLVGRTMPRSVPSVSVPTEAAARARDVIGKLGLAPKNFAAVFVGGLANVPIKAWPYPKFGELVHALETKHQLPSLILAHESEAAVAREVAERARALGGTQRTIWLGRDGEIALLAGLLAEAKLYVGHDTGAMHIAAAVGRPVVGIFGGGHWPRFRPVGRQTVSVVEPLPCFGCNWDCRFGDAPCVKTLTSADVLAGVERVLAAAEAPINDVVEVQHFSPESLRLIEAVTVRYGKLQADRLERQHRIEELKQEADIKDTEIASLKSEADTKDEEIAGLKKETDAKDAEIEEKDVEIADLKRAAEERKREMESIKAELEAECADKDKEIAELKAEADTKDGEIADLKNVCNEREQLILTLDGHIKNFQTMVATLRSEIASKDQQIAEVSARLAKLEDTFSKLPPEAEKWAEKFNDKDVHIRNIEGLLQLRDREISSLSASVANYQSGFGALEQVKHYSKLLAEKETVIQNLHKACVEREAVIKQLALDAAGPAGKLNKLWLATKKHLELKHWTPFNEWLFKKVVEDYWMQIGVLTHYEPRPLKWDSFPKPRVAPEELPKLGIVTPSYGQAAFIESTMLSVLNQKYPKLRYVVQDGGSKDASPQIIAKYADQVFHWESTKDKGQADAIRKGFLHLEKELGPDDVMAWLNSDDFIAPKALRFVAEYFARHPDVDVIYGHRIIIDSEDREVGRWIMPRHDPKTLEWIDYVPQETLFWRKRVWDRVGGIDPSFQFALDWDLLARFQQSKATIVRVPYFLGCFRVHREQKTSQHIHTVGNEEMIKIRSRFHGERHSDFKTIEHFARKARFTGALTARLAALGIRY